MFICLAIYSVCQYYTVLQFKRPTSQRYFEALMESSNVDWKDICYHARPLLTFGTVKSENLKSPLCKSAEEIIIHLFSECLFAQYIFGIKLRSSFQVILLSLMSHWRVPFLVLQTPELDTFYQSFVTNL